MHSNFAPLFISIFCPVPLKRVVYGIGCLWISAGLLACATPTSKVGLTCDEWQNSGASSMSSQRLVATSEEVEANRVRPLVGDTSNEQSLALDRLVASRLTRLGARSNVRGWMFLMDTHFFTSEQVGIAVDGYAFLHELSEVLHLDSRRTVLIEAFIDSEADERVNRSLSERRGTAVRSALVSMGIDGRRISSRGVGSAYPFDVRKAAIAPIAPTTFDYHKRLEIFVSESSGIIPSR